MTRQTPLAICFTLCLASVAHAQDDQLFTETGSTLNGKVVSASPVQVKIEVNGNERVVKVNEIRRLSFGGEPTELNVGRARVLSGKIQSGHNELKRVDPATITREIIRRDLQFYLAYCEGKLALTVGGDKAKATAGMLAFVRAVPNSHHFFEAAELLGDLAVSQKDFAGAVRYYGTIASKAPFGDYKMRASILEARALVAQGDFSKAQSKFEDVLAISSGTRESKRQKLLA